MNRCLAFLLFLLPALWLSAQDKQLFELRLYHLEEDAQLGQMDNYLEKALIPALHRLGIGQVGVFAPRAGEEMEKQARWLLIPHGSWAVYEGVPAALEADEAYQQAAAPFLSASHESPPYARMEVFLMHAFASFPGLGIPEHPTPREDQVYELRSYESATEALAQRKVDMFNEGETEIFVSLGFQPVFFGQVLASSRLPHLMYMTTHADEEGMQANWNSFRSDPRWEKMKGMKRYAHTVSHIDKYLLCPTAYSDF
jgi:hypothetical protein